MRAYPLVVDSCLNIVFCCIKKYKVAILFFSDFIHAFYLYSVRPLPTSNR